VRVALILRLTLTHECTGLTDMVIVETAVNDYECQYKLRTSAELLLRILQELKNRGGGGSKIGPALLYLGVSTNNKMPWQERGDTILEQLLVTQAYGIPHLSLLDGFQPFSTQIDKYWFNDIYKGDWTTHLSITGHEVVAGYLFSFIRLLSFQAQDAITQATYNQGPREVVALKRLKPVSGPAYATAEEINIHITGSPYYVNFYDKSWSPGLCMGLGFTKTMDVPNKYGLIGNEVADRVSVVLPTHRLSNTSAPSITDSPYQLMTVEYLSSFEGMGVMKLTLTACDDSCSVSNTSKGSATVIASQLVDSLDSKTNFSIARSVQLNFSSYVRTYQSSDGSKDDIRRSGSSGHRFAARGDSFLTRQLELFTQQEQQINVAADRRVNWKVPCGYLKLTVEIVDASILGQTSRQNNKVKIFAVSLY
jgi:hypothetical protein